MRHLVPQNIRPRSFRRKHGLILPDFSRNRRLGMRGGVGALFITCHLSQRPNTNQRAPGRRELERTVGTRKVWSRTTEPTGQLSTRTGNRWVGASMDAEKISLGLTTVARI